MTRDDHLRIPPNAIEAEQSVIGGLMLDPKSIAKVSDWLAEDDFYRRDHRALYRAINLLAGKGKPCDTVTMIDWLRDNGLLEIVGGATYVLELSNNTPSAANIIAYAEIVKQKSQLRELIEAGTEIAGEAFDGKASAVDIAAKATQQLGRIAANVNRGGLRPAKALMRDWFSDLTRLYEIGERVTGLPTPWKALNEATHGLQDGELILLPARPNMGKSVAGFNLATFTALRGQRTAVFSLEMTANQIIRRSIACLAGVPHDWLKAPTNEDDDSELYWPRITNASADLKAAPLWIDDEPSLTIEQIRGRALREHLHSPLRLVVIDHAHIIARPGKNDASEYGVITRGAKALAKELSCPVVLLAQLNRGVESRTEKRPMMSDLRASGEFEQDADLILFLYRDDYYNSATHLQGVVEVEIGKGRDVKTGQRIHLKNRFDQMRLEDWEGPLPEQPKYESKSAPARGRRGFDGMRAAAGGDR